MGRFRCAWLLAVGALACGKGDPPPEVVPPRTGGYPLPEHVIPLLVVENPKLEETAYLLAQVVNPHERRAASLQLIGEANRIADDAWRQAQRPLLQRMNGDVVLTAGQELRWLDEWQKRHFVRVYDAMTRLGGEVVMSHCRATVASQTRQPTERQLALAVLASHDQVAKGPPRPGETWGMPGQSDPLAGPGATRWPGAAAGGPPAAPRAPQSGPVSAAAEPPRVTGGAIINANEVVAALQPYFLICYQRALAVHGRFGAWVIMRAEVASDGRVSRVTGSGDDSVAPDFMACLHGVVAQARFARPAGGEALVEIPLSFTVSASYQPPAGAPP